ncbi:MAG: DUF559 domain-containing protein [Candidatus Methylomirabilaceae bacterium]
MQEKLALARELRREPTPAERHAWSLLRNRGLLGLKFRRQHVLHGFIVDFYCSALKLIVELDGRLHDRATQVGFDAARTAWLTGAGYRVIRVRNRELTRGCLEELVGEIMREMNSSVSPPSPEGRGGQGVRTEGRGGRGETRSGLDPYELLDGQHVATPSPAVPHQAVLRELATILIPFLREQDRLELFWSPADVVLGDRTLVQPDLFVVAVVGG